MQRIEAVTDSFFFWQGLRLIPVGVALMVVGLSLSPAVPLPKPVRPWIGLPVLLGSLWLSSTVIGGYYARHFGRVRADASRHPHRATVKWMVVYPAMVLAMVVDAVWHPPIIVGGVVFAIGVEAFRESTGGGRFHYIAAAIALVVFACLPTLGLLQNRIDALAWLIVVTGMIYTIGGLLDHRELVGILDGATSLGDVGTI